MRNWIEVKAIFAAPQIDWSPIAEVFDRHGCPGTLEQDTPPALISYIAEVPGSSARIKALTDDLFESGAIAVSTEDFPEENWSENWKQYFTTRHVGKVVIRPTWEPYEPKGSDVVVSLDPGQAFGTGDHPTTRLCLDLIQKVVMEGKGVADVGCGSGILAIAAAKLGSATVFASDIDPRSVEIAKENATLNDVQIPMVDAPGFDALQGEYDVLMSNIITATLIRLAPSARNYIKPGGCWIVSGIIRANWEDLKTAVVAEGFRLENKEEEDDWVGAIFRL